MSPSEQSAPHILELPILPIRNTVIFPVLAFPINVGRKKSIGAVEDALSKERYMAIFAQKDPAKENPGEFDLYEIGSMIKIIKHVKMPGNKLSETDASSFSGGGFISG